LKLKERNWHEKLSLFFTCPENRQPMTEVIWQEFGDEILLERDGFA